jgi:hypothetical protein
LLCTALACGPVQSGGAEGGEESGGEASETFVSPAESESESESGTEETGALPDLGSPEPYCCGCLCVDAGWSCSEDNCQNDVGEALALESEAGFFEIPGGDYVVNGQPASAGHARVWYSFAPAEQDPEDKPLIVLFNGGPGSATASLLVYNIGPYTMDPSLTGDQTLVPTVAPWTEFANLLFIDAPNTGFSYARALEGGEQPSVGIDREHDAGVVLRALLRFLVRHPQLGDGPVILAGESYAGVRVQLMLEYLFNHAWLGEGEFQDLELRAEIEDYLSWTFPDATEWTPELIATRFPGQILIQALVAGFVQMNLPLPNQPPGCIDGGDLYQCDEADGFTFARINHAAAGLTQLDALETLLGVDPTSVAWLHAEARLDAYGRSNVSAEEQAAVDLSEFEAVFGELNADDRHYLAFNYEVFSTKEGADHPWDSSVGESFLRNALLTEVFITNAAFDLAIWGPNLPLALEGFPFWVSAAVHDSEPRPGVERPGWIQLDYVDAPQREIRFPGYVESGHMVNLRQPEDLAADLQAWLAQ